MKITVNLFLLASFVSFMSCSDGNTNKEGNTPGTAPSTMAAPTNTAALNPPHGQPGHRCDIEVGAPLNTPAAPNLPMPNLNPLPAQGTVVPGTNPPHGEPGHDCAVPVGAPLNK
ncbi:hypothetical protein D770_23360 [Flammeovirgaceae bacterium 311]|nr:hypothetical protein D770_23360 [Flammeovirgaceae bacterium 311]